MSKLKGLISDLWDGEPFFFLWPVIVVVGTGYNTLDSLDSPRRSKRIGALFLFIFIATCLLPLSFVLMFLLLPVFTLFMLGLGVFKAIRG